jgi:hypothetical protein
MKVLSLGWGVQSFTLAAMCALGEFEKPDVAIHADTGHEGAGTYAYAAEMTAWLEERGVRVVTVRNKNEIVIIIPNGSRKIDMPVFSLSLSGDKGQTQRRCTGDWKIKPVNRQVSNELKHRGLRKTQGVVEMWMGISTDEALRMKPARVKYITNRWPLIELGMSRNDCKAWLKEHGLPEPPRSSCVFCPYHSVREWREVQSNDADWEKAVQVDEMIRHQRPPYRLYIHPARIPLDQIDFRTEQEKGQLTLWDEECEGLCGV